MAKDLLELAGSLPFLDELYSQYQIDPNSVDPSWRKLFENGASTGNGHANGNGHGAYRTTVGAALAEAAAATPMELEAHLSAHPSVEARFARVYGLVNAYRTRGHLEAKLDPLD